MAGVLLAALLAAPAATTLQHLWSVLWVDGPNTVGEAGKVFFAHRFRLGEAIFLPADVPPYYPSVHGPLVHVTVGAVGELLGSATRDLYFIGRSVSVACTLLAAWLCNGVLARLGVSVALRLVALAVVLCGEAVLRHATSYRPDHWIVFFSALACRLLVDAPTSRRRLAILALLPVVAFFVKPSALWLGAAVPLVLWLGGQRKAAVAVASLCGVALATTIALIQWSSGGAFLAAFASGMGVPFDPLNYGVLVNAPHVLLLLFMPLPALVRARPRFQDRDQGRAWLALACFWALSLLAGLAAMLRSGSHIYYLLDAHVYAALICTAWGSRRVSVHGEGTRPPRPAGKAVGAPPHREVRSTHGAGKTAVRGGGRERMPRRATRHAGGRSPRLSPPALAAFAYALLSLWPWSVSLGHDTRGMAVGATERFGRFRGPLAAELNREGHRALSDDAGLNVLLDRPAVIYTLIPAMMLRAGTLSFEQLARPIRDHEYDLIVLTGRRWRYRGIHDPPPELLEAIFWYYQPIPNDTAYMFLIPRTREPGSAPPGP